jgi:hypothetical protein
MARATVLEATSYRTSVIRSLKGRVVRKEIIAKIVVHRPVSLRLGTMRDPELENKHTLGTVFIVNQLSWNTIPRR